MTRRHALSGIAWTVAQRWAVRATTLVVFVILGRLLEPKDFGIVALAGVFVGLLSVFGDFGFTTYLVQSRSVDRCIVSTVFWAGLALSITVSAALAVSADAIAGLLNTPELGPVLRVLSVGIVIHGLSATPTALLKRDLMFRTLALRSVLATAVSSVVAVALALAGAGVWALVGQALTLSSVSTAVLWLAGGWRPSRSFDRATARRAMSYGASVLGIQLVGQLRRRGVDLVIGATAGPVLLGYWTVATRILAVIFDTVVQAISTVSTPVLARLQDDLPRLRRAYLLAVSSSLALITPVLAVLLVAAPELIVLAFGPRWSPAASAAQVMSIATLFTTMVYFDRGLMLALGRERTELIFSITTTACRLAIVWFVASQGLRAIAVAILVLVAVTWPVRVLLTSTVLGIPAAPQLLIQTRTIVAGSAAAAVALVLDDVLASTTSLWVVVAADAGVVAMTYPAFLWLINRPALAGLREIVPRRRPSQPEAPDRPLDAPSIGHTA